MCIKIFGAALQIRAAPFFAVKPPTSNHGRFPAICGRQFHVRLERRTSAPSATSSSPRQVLPRQRWRTFPAAKGKLTGMTRSVPTIVVSMVDLTVEFEKETTWKRTERR